MEALLRKQLLNGMVICTFKTTTAQSRIHELRNILDRAISPAHVICFIDLKHLQHSKKTPAILHVVFD